MGEARPPAPQPSPVANLKTAWAAAQRRAGITPRYRLHDLRACFITDVAKVAGNRVVQSLARHISATTTARYVKVVDGARRAAVEAAARPRLRVLAGAENPRNATQVSHSEPPAQSEKAIKLLK